MTKIKSKRVLRPRKGQYALISDALANKKKDIKLKELVTYRTYTHCVRCLTTPDEEIDRTLLTSGVFLEFYPSGRVLLFLGNYNDKVSASCVTIISTVFDTIKHDEKTTEDIWKETFQSMLKEDEREYKLWKDVQLVTLLDSIVHFDAVKLSYLKKAETNRCVFIGKIEKL